MQGFTEFLPISSSAHPILPSAVLSWEDQGLAFDVAVHVGTLAAVVIYFRKEVISLLSAFFGSVFAGRPQQKSEIGVDDYPCDDSMYLWPADEGHC